MLLQLADDEVVAQVHQADAAQARLIQGRPGQAGDGFRRHLPAEPVRDHHGGRDRPLPLEAQPQAGLRLPVQRDGPVRQTELVVRKGDVVPCEALDLLPGQPLPPGQAEDQSRSCLFLLRQQAAHRRLIRPSDGVLPHSRLLNAGDAQRQAQCYAFGTYRLNRVLFPPCLPVSPDRLSPAAAGLTSLPRSARAAPSMPEVPG